MINRILILALFFSSCEREHVLQFLSPYKAVSSNSLYKNGFSRVYGVDVLLYQKTVNDTITYYQFDNNGKLYSQWWEIGVDSIGDKTLDNIINQYGAVKVSECNSSDIYYILNTKHNILISVNVLTQPDNKFLFTYLFPK